MTGPITSKIRDFLIGRDPATPEPTLLGALGLEAFATRTVKP